MRTRWAVIPAVALMATSIACSRNPEAKKQRHLQAGDEFVKQEKYDAAVLEYRSAIQQDARFGDARFKLAQTYMVRGDVVNALKEAVRAADLLPERTDVQLFAARVLLLTGRFADARVRAETVLAREPKNIDAEIARANALAGLQDLEGAVSQAEEAVSLDPERSATYSTLGALRAASGDMEKAEEAFAEAVTRNPSSVNARLTFAQFLWQSSRLDRAEKMILDALALDPKHMLGNRMAASFYAATNRPDQSEPFLKAAAEIDGGQKLALADYYMARKRPEDALPVLDTVATADPKLRAAAQIRIASVYARSGDMARATTEVETVLAKEPRNVGALLTKLEILMMQKKVDDALVAADAAVAAGPKLPAAHYARGRVLVALGRTDDAKRAFNEVLQLNPKAEAAKMQLADLHLRSGATETSVTLAGDVAKNNPGSVEARLLLSRGLLARHDFAQAKRVLTALAAEAPTVPEVHAQLGVLLAVQKDLDGARKAFDRAIALDANNVEATAGLLGLDMSAGRADEARRRAQALVDAIPSSTAARLLAARTLMLLRDTAGAAPHLTRAIELNPNLLAAYSMLGQIYMVEGKLDEARAEFEKLATRQVPPVAALTTVGMIQLLQHKTADARKTFERVMQIDSHAAVAANNLAWIYADGGENLDVALQLAQTAMAELPDQAEVNDTLGWVYYRKGLLPQAMRALQHAVELRPKDASFQFHLGMALAKNGDAAEARRALETALKLNPSFSGAAEATATIDSLAPTRDGQDARR